MSAPVTLYIAATKYHIYLGSLPGDDGLWLMAQCLGGPHDGSAIPVPISREHATTMWPVFKRWAENGERT